MELSELPVLIAGGALSIYLLMLSIMFIGWYNIMNKRIKGQVVSSVGISIIVAAHNEENHLEHLLSGLIEQDYKGKYEIVIVLDRCSDGSEHVVNSFVSSTAPINIIRIFDTPKGWSPKKWAIEVGISHAEHNVFAFTDADCTVSSRWLSEITLHLQNNEEVLLGLGKYKVYPEWINLFIRFETFYTAFQYMGLASLGIPYMAVGRNLVYTRHFYESSGGMNEIKHRLSGDDDILINKYAGNKRIGLMITPDSTTFSEPKHTFLGLFYQKTRHLSASHDYRWQTKLLLGLFHFSHALFYCGILVCLSLGESHWEVAILYGIKTLVGYIIFHNINKVMQEPKIINWFPILDLLTFIYNLIIVPIGLIRTPAWKK